MLEKKVRITKHVLNRCQRRAKKYIQRTTHKSIYHKLMNLISRAQEEDLIHYRETIFLGIKLNRGCGKIHYLIMEDNGIEYATVTIYTEEMFNKRYGNKIKGVRDHDICRGPTEN